MHDLIHGRPFLKWEGIVSRSLGKERSCQKPSSPKANDSPQLRYLSGRVMLRNSFVTEYMYKAAATL